MIGALHEDMVVTDFHHLCLFLGGDVTSFTGKLLELIAKADPGNRAKLFRVYPREVAAFEHWQAAPILTAAELDRLLK